MAASSMEDLVSLCKRRGFIFQSAEIYGGLQGTYDYGPLGVELKNNLKAAWWRAMVYDRDDVDGLDSVILTHRAILRHSGHEDTFTDPLVDCLSCKRRWRADQIDGACPNCGSTELTAPRPFNLMFKTTVGPVEDAGDLAYLRPETAQGIFVNFRNVVTSMSRALPFGIAQIGKAFRNEITPRNFIFRVREFEQMELEFFVTPGEDETWHEYWIQQRLAWWRAQGLEGDDLVLYRQEAGELAHYAKATSDILFRFPHGVEELEGVANRTDFDLGSHSRGQEELNLTAKVAPNQDSNTRLFITTDDGRQIVPYVIEPSAGVDRGVLAVLASAYTREDLGDGKDRLVLKLKPHLAPVKVAVFPLARNKPELREFANKVVAELRALSIGRIAYEGGGNIGKNYRRHDEIGTPLCVTVDFGSIGADEGGELAGTVTVRDRDTMQQTRVHIDDLADYVEQVFRPRRARAKATA